MRPLLPPTDLWLTVEQLNQALKKWPRVQLSVEKLADKAANTNLDYLPLPDIGTQGQSKQPLEKLRQFVEHFDGTVIFSVESEGRRETVTELLGRIKIRPETISHYSSPVSNRFAIMIGAAEHGFIQSVQHRALICESDLLGERVVRRRTDNRRTINTDTLIRNLAELRPGQPVVHIEHGVGRYQGLTTLEAGGIKAEYLILTYAGNDKLYVPVSSLHLISRYSGGADENAPLHRLGSDSWGKRDIKPQKSP